MSELRTLVQTKCGRNLASYQFKFNGNPLEESNHGRRLTFQDHGINKEDTVFLMKIGFDLDIVQPQVSHYTSTMEVQITTLFSCCTSLLFMQVDICFMMDCTGSMGSWIESVKQNVTSVRDRLESQYKGCDLRVSFVRYTDYDQPESSRTTRLDFTKYVTYSSECLLCMHACIMYFYRSLTAFRNFVDPIKAKGGGDGPEDIMGALKVTLSTLSWRSSSAKVNVFDHADKLK